MVIICMMMIITFKVKVIVTIRRVLSLSLAMMMMMMMVMMMVMTIPIMPLDSQYDHAYNNNYVYHFPYHPINSAEHVPKVTLLVVMMMMMTNMIDIISGLILSVSRMTVTISIVVTITT